VWNSAKFRGNPYVFQKSPYSVGSKKKHFRRHLNRKPIQQIIGGSDVYKVGGFRRGGGGCRGVGCRMSVVSGMAAVVMGRSIELNS
jgi:hypothetical protein